MGKQKGSKNRPSSSSMAASLLPSGAATVGFGGYLGSSKIERPSSSETSSLEVDSEVTQHLSRLGRKDPTTKIKALTSLCLLFKQRSGEEIVQIVPQWAFEYKRLLLDYDREVRRSTHDAMTSLVLTVRKGLVPNLKSLMGPWWFSQFDPIPEVAQAAKKSIEAAFPASDRRLDALMLRVNEIFVYLDENLKLTPQSMSDKAMPMDELEDMHQRVLSSSLLAVATLVDILLGAKIQNLDSASVSTEQRLAYKARLTTISSAEKMFSTHHFFLDFFKSKSLIIRSATYSVLTSFIKHLPQAFNDGNMKSISSAILGVFQEKDASCHSTMWDMVLLFPRKFQNCWSYVNIQKIVLSRFWNFLRHGCYGSQLISYPALVLFLESVPPEVVGGEQFVINFFENLWAGRNTLHSSGADNLAFFKAFRECFLWVLNNASRYKISICRYNVCGNAVNPLLVKLNENILVTLLWHDYLLSVNLKNKEESFEEGIQKSMETHSGYYPLSYVEELGKCIIGILSDISSKEPALLTDFSKSFHKDCLEIFQKEERKPKFQEHVDRLSKFCHLLDESVWKKGQTWPLHYLAGPLFLNCFKVIQTMDSPTAVNFLCILVGIFGPVTLFSCLYFCNEDRLSISYVDDISNETKAKYFLQAFRDDFVPWCLSRCALSSSEKLELLISLIQDEFFSEQWCIILTYAIDPENYAAIDSEVLNILIEKVKEKIRKMKKENALTIGYLPEHWQHQLLDSAAVLVAHHTCSSISSAQFLRSVLGGACEDDKTCFLSGAAVTKIFEEILKRLASYISTSPFKWAKLSSSLLLSSGSIGIVQNEKLSISDKLKMAQLAFEVLEGSMFSINMLGNNSMLLPSTLAAIFIIDWECSMSSCIREENNYSLEESEAKLTLGRKMHALHHNINISFWKNISLSNLSTLRSILVHILRSAVFETNNLSSNETSSLYCEWALHLLEVTSHDQAEMQNFLDQLLSIENSWPLWVSPPDPVKCGSATIQVEREHESIEVLRHNQFTAFVDKLISNLGFPEVIARSVPQTEHTSSFSRAWLAAELLCTWRWQGGNVVDSFFSSLSKYAVYESSHPEEHVILSILSILLDGILIRGVNNMWISVDAWITSDDEVENIQDPFLRALTFLLLTLFVKDKVWRKHEALEIFKKVVDKLFIDGNVDRTCLRVLPFVMSVLVEPLLLQSTEFDESSKDVVLAHWKDDSVIKNVLRWLETALSFPPIGIGHEESDLEEWVQLIVSCYPLRTTLMFGTCKVDIVRDISHLEMILLLNLFQKHRSGYDASLAPSSTQMILSKLTVISIGYCWKEFSQDDWHFVLDNLQKWIELSVLMIEEIVEKIDEITVSYTSKSNLEPVIEKLELAVKTLDPITISISSTALIILSQFSQLADLEEADSVEVFQSIKLEKWSEIKDRVLENILRLFFATGISEAIASSLGSKASLIIASNRAAYSQFWARVSSFVINAPNHVKSSSVKSMELWGLSKGSISSLYAILFSSKPIPSLQNAAYRLISTEPLCRFSFLKGNDLGENVNVTEDSNLNNIETSSSDSISLMDEISFLIQKPAAKLLEMDLISLDRINVFLAWGLLLSYLHSLPRSSSAREALIQYVQESIGSSILDCILQNIPLKQVSSNTKKKDNVLSSEALIAASAAKNIIDSGSTMLHLESFFPIGNEQMASFAGSIYGMMIWQLPTYVSNWFASMRDRALVSAIESFTKAWCSPSLISNELSQVKETVMADENFSVSVNKSAYEIIATYKKEETGMDLVIRLPNCYPLHPVDVDCTRSLGISEVKKRKWLLSLTAFVRNQNGAIGEAIRTWKNNLDKEFLGVEECPICYSIIHTSNHSLPRLACKTCKHKFHSACLYKWFSTSHKSTCPLCQTPF